MRLFLPLVMSTISLNTWGRQRSALLPSTGRHPNPEVAWWDTIVTSDDIKQPPIWYDSAGKGIISACATVPHESVRDWAKQLVTGSGDG